MDLHKAIRSIYTNAVSIFGNTQEDIIALDKDQKKISYLRFIKKKYLFLSPDFI